jgi:hypothetical protein
MRAYLLQFFILFSAIASSFSANAAVSVTAQLDRNAIMVGETISLSVVIEGSAPEAVEPPPSVPGLSIQYRGNSRNITSINGETSIKHILNYAVTATQVGQFTIPPITVTVGGKNYATQPVAITVTKADVSAQNRYAFLRLNVPKTELYVGEIIPIELQLYVVDAENLQAPQFKNDGFVVHKQLEHTRSQAQVGNVLYSVLNFRMTISAAKAGKLTLGPAEMNLVLRLRAQPDPNDMFGFFGRFQRRPMTVTSPPVEMNVLPLPSPAPPEFSGAIGKYSWTVNAAPTNLNAGDPITIKIAITGRGNLDNVKLPNFDWPNFNVYQPTSSIASNDPLGMEGSKNFEQVVVPQNASVHEIPEISFAFFDPEQKTYVKLKNRATPLKIAPGASPAVSSPTLSNTEAPNEETPRNDIVHIKSDSGPLVALAPPLIQQPWFLVLQTIPLFGVIGLTIWRKKQEQLARNPRLRRKLEVQHTVEAGLAELRALAQSQESEPFYALLFRLMQEQIGERLDLPASAITEAVLDERPPARGASPDLLQRLRQLFQVCNQARYARAATNAELLSLTSDLENALRELQQLPDR